MEYDYVHYGLFISALINLYLFFMVRTLRAREKRVLKVSEELLTISEIFSSELHQLKNEAEDV